MNDPEILHQRDSKLTRLTERHPMSDELLLSERLAQRDRKIQELQARIEELTHALAKSAGSVPGGEQDTQPKPENQA